MKHLYKRTYMTTGEVQVFEFNTSHNAAFNGYEIMSRARLEKVKQNLINHWNSQGNGTWKYALTEEVVEPCTP